MTTALTTATAIEVVLFDLGGVLIELGGIRELASFAGEPGNPVENREPTRAAEDELWRRWLTCPWVRRFERGECDADSFARGMVDSWSMNVGPETFKRAFISWPRGLLPGAREIVQSIDSRLRVGCLSNTNELHAERQWREFGLSDLFEDRFFSHEMGLVKPDRETFDFVVEALGCTAGNILFLDDNQINVSAAREAGLRSDRARGIAEAREILTRNGLTSA